MENVRYYSENEYLLGPPRDQIYGIGKNGEPIQHARDARMRVSIEWAREVGWNVPENWRELA